MFARKPSASGGLTTAGIWSTDPLPGASPWTQLGRALKVKPCIQSQKQKSAPMLAWFDGTLVLSSRGSPADTVVRPINTVCLVLSSQIANLYAHQSIALVTDQWSVVTHCGWCPASWSYSAPIKPTVLHTHDFASLMINPRSVNADAFYHKVMS